jgi:hypothetical protein
VMRLSKGYETYRSQLEATSVFKAPMISTVDLNTAA